MNTFTTVPRDLLDLLGCPNCWLSPEQKKVENTGRPQQNYPPLVDDKCENLLKQNGPTVNSSATEWLVDRPPLQSEENALWCTVCGTRFSINEGIIQLLSTNSNQLLLRESLRDFYEDQYQELNQDWHTQDSLSKACELLKALPEGFRPNRILEVGCGAGLVLEYIQSATGASLAVGTDLSLAALSSAKKLNAERWLVQADGERLPFRTQSFDLIIDADIIEHMISPSALLLEQARVGKFLVAKVPVEEAMYTWFLDAVGQQRKRHLSQKYGHLHHFLHNEIIRLISDNGFFPFHVSSIPIPNRQGWTKHLQDFTFQHLSSVYPFIWGGFAIVGAVSRFSINHARQEESQYALPDSWAKA